MKKTFLLGCVGLSFAALVVAQTKTAVPQRSTASTASKSAAPAPAPAATRRVPAQAATAPVAITASAAARTYRPLGRQVISDIRHSLAQPIPMAHLFLRSHWQTSYSLSVSYF